VDILAGRLPTVTPPAKDAAVPDDKPKAAVTGGTPATGVTPKAKPATGQENSGTGAVQSRPKPATGAPPATPRPNPDAATPGASAAPANPSKAVAEQANTDEPTAKDSPR